ncbi:Crp/Fnr family transcriptional regulator [Alkalibacter rhizosphaerae]|uniref:Crp/Fnr family transcriptional regulator n=1 Tax=Alkalibacter rhizosphaerae TaxID=2815577 RepID=A0A975AJ37_9FIRM|nr:Crp/Fnr family transcriptional regulator [Alkalibacter rhizosphaerae]QSX09175.1 Crp/Fnr family transcriptional regulator [Alkalibacter rhizosphaerae]
MYDQIKCMKDLSIFSALNEEEKAQIPTIAEARTIKKGETVFLEGDPADTVYLIRKGKILLYKISEEGKEISLDLLQEDDFFGENTIFDNLLHTMNAKALEDTFVCTCSNANLPALLSNPNISVKIIRALGEKLNTYTDQIAAMAFQDVKGRVLGTLQRLAREYGKATNNGVRIDVVLNHQDLANLVNASRVMVTRTLAVLKEEGVIHHSKHHFYLKDRNDESCIDRPIQ